MLWADLMLFVNDAQDSVAAICSFCNLNKLIESITTAFGEGISTMIARVGAALMTN